MLMMMLRLWSLWAKVGAVGNALALSTASQPVRVAHRPQIHSLRFCRLGEDRAACFILGFVTRFLADGARSEPLVGSPNSCVKLRRIRKEGQ